MEIKAFIKQFTTTAKGIIGHLEDYRNLSNEAKKQRLDSDMTDWALKWVDELELNIVVKFVLKKLLIPNISTITQAIFDLIKSKVEGITK